MDPETIAEAGKQSQYFRTPEFSKLMLECADMLRELLDAPEDALMIFLTASGTAAMEASVINLFTPKDRVLVLSGGTFGKRFKEICQIHHIPIESIDLEWNEAFRPEMLAAYENKGISGMLVNMCETSTGQLYPMNVISEFCARNGICLVIDAISSFLCDGFRMRTTGAGAVIISSQKGLALQPGMSFVAVTKEAFETRCKQNNPETLYFRFTGYYPEILRGQTEFTPAVGIVNQLHEKLKRIIRDGGTWPQIYHVMKLAEYFRQQLLKNTRFTYPLYPLSNGVTPVLCSKNNAEKIVAFLRDTHKIYVVPAAGNLVQSTFRVAHMSRQLTEQDIDELIGLLRLI
ncbi:MAG: aminotransferase class V-fold PLP-dependent enzyme [Spirochaetaceae bacterium]|jgi:aspartate aminotransferase-like enzyme|nr:aminotransferase class V-fold PLP-dependent enzyme [Spirochaetaceae bacterium]